MKKATLLAIIITLFIGSCTKEKSPQPDEAKQEMVEVNGVLYDIDDLRRKLSITTGVAEERLYFVVENMAFHEDKYGYEFKLSEYIESLNTIE